MFRLFIGKSTTKVEINLWALAYILKLIILYLS
jgi:hypothetical protein